MKIKDPSRTEELIKEVVFLLWNAAGGTSGMGFLQNSPGSNKEDVFKQASGGLDYAMTNNKPGDIYMDYVFGRCMKTGIKYDVKEGTFRVFPNKPKATYQNWGRKYKTADEAVAEAMVNLGLEEAS